MSHVLSRPVVAAIALAVMAVALYLPAAGFEFVNYDDNEYVYANALVAGGLTLGAVGRAFSSFHAANWHPLTWISHMIDVQVFGFRPGAHHGVNVLLHVANVLLLLYVLHRLTHALGASAAVAGLFALHPLNVETVAWVAERKSLLSTMAWLLAIEAYRRWTLDRTVFRYLLLTGAFVAGLLSKPMIVTLPATLLILDVWPLRRLTLELLTDRTRRRELAGLVVEKLPLFALSAISSAITIAGQASAGATTTHATYPMSARLATALESLAWYAAKAFVPSGLCVMHPHPLVSGVPTSGAVALLSLVLVIGLSFLAIRSMRTRPWLAAGWFWYLVTLLPVLGLIQVGAQSHADRYAYVPLLGIFIAIVWTVREWSSPRSTAVIAVAGSLVLITFAVLARRQLATWRDSGTLFARALEVHPGSNPIARKNLAAHYSEVGAKRKAAGDLASALALYHEATALHPEAGVLYNEAAVLSDLQRYAEAIPLYRKSLSLQSSNADAWLNLGDAEVVTGDYGSAVTSYRRVLSMRADKYAFYGLSYACAHLGDRECAASAFEQVRIADPSLASALAAQLN